MKCMTSYINNKIISLDFIQKGVNKKFQEVVHQFSSSVLSLFPGVLIKSRELSTTKCYQGWFEKWDSWSKQFPEISTIPVDKKFIILYLLSLLQTGKSYPAIRSSNFAIKYFHKILGHHAPCNSELVNYVLEVIKKFVVIPLKRKNLLPHSYFTHYTDHCNYSTQYTDH